MKKFTLILALFFLSVTTIHASYGAVNNFNYVNNENFDISPFQTVTDIYSPKIEFPTLVQLPLTPEEYRYNYAEIKEINTGQFQPYQITSISIPPQITSHISDLLTNSEVTELTDKSPATFVDFPLVDGQAKATLQIVYDKTITTSRLNFGLAPNVATPQTISISAISPNHTKNTTVLNQAIFPVSGYINFPTTSSQIWQIEIVSNQPIRLTSLDFEIIAQPINQTGLRFLARPNESYQIYLQPDRYVNNPHLTSGNYDKLTPVITINDLIKNPNPDYLPSDQDSDKIPDEIDNCHNTPNINQKDLNGNGIGDACEDFDLDGIMNDTDNCPNHPNPRQQDTDSDGIGDHCDESESRFTESYPFIPWLGLGFGFIVVILLLATTRSKYSAQKENLSTQSTDKITDNVVKKD